MKKFLCLIAAVSFLSCATLSFAGTKKETFGGEGATIKQIITKNSGVTLVFDPVKDGVADQWKYVGYDLDDAVKNRILAVALTFQSTGEEVNVFIDDSDWTLVGIQQR